MSYKIVVDSCCELPEEYLQDPRFEIVPLGLEVGDYQIQDDENFNQAEFLKKVAECPKCPKSACPSPERFREAYHTEAEHVYVITLSSHLSGSYNSAVLGRIYIGKNTERNRSTSLIPNPPSCGETQIVKKLVELEEQRLSFEEIVKQIEEFRSNVHTYFVLDNLDTLRKNGRLTGVKALVASTLSIKPIMAGDKGSIVQRGQSVGMKKALRRMAEIVLEEAGDTKERFLMITHCNAPGPRRDHEEASYGKGRVQRMPDHGHPRCQQHVRQRWRRDRDGVKRLIS